MLRRLVILVAVFVIMAVGMSGQPDKAPESKQTSPSDCQSAPISVDSHYYNYSHTPQTPTKLGDESFDWHTVVKRPEWWAIGIAIGTLILIFWQAWETRKASEAAQNATQTALLNTQISIRSERAWIVIKVESAGKNKFHFKAVNEGRTPANITSIRGFPRVVRRNRVEPPLDDKDGESLTNTPPCLLPATASCTALFCNIEELRGTDSIEDFLRYIASGLFEIWFYGRVVYYDILEPAPQTPHQTDWFFWHLPVHDTLPIVDPRHPEHNTYT